jgi:2-polyprenyl-6-methoxyphenol hydroxylase-like FAD-dependent oxidoreductase
MFLSLKQVQAKTTAPAIAIIGGGPCGLTLARLLERKGIDYVVFERDESENSNRTGGSLDIHPDSGQIALRKCGLFDDFKRYARYDDTVFTLADKHGKRIVQLGQGRDSPEIDRSDLRQILLDAIPKDKIKWGHALRSAKLSEDNKPVLQFANGVVLSDFKLVVGTDGAWSKIRPLVRSHVSFFRQSYINLLTIPLRSPQQLLDTLGRAPLNPELALGTLYMQRWPATSERGLPCPLVMGSKS